MCKAPINNLPEPPPAPATEAGSDAGGSMFDDGDDRNHAHPLHGPFAVDQMPGSADIVFDCIRVGACCQGIIFEAVLSNLELYLIEAFSGSNILVASLQRSADLRQCNAVGPAL